MESPHSEKVRMSQRASKQKLPLHELHKLIAYCNSHETYSESAHPISICQVHHKWFYHKKWDTKTRTTEANMKWKRRIVERPISQFIIYIINIYCKNYARYLGARTIYLHRAVEFSNYNLISIVLSCWYYFL